MLRIIDKATSDPVTLAQAKAQLRVTDTSQDALINVLIPAATKLVQSLVQRAFMNQTLEWVLPYWRSRICLPIAPVTADAVNSIVYVDWISQAKVTLDPSLYVVQTEGDSVAIIPKFGTIWPIVFSFASEPIVINFDAGADNVADVPANIQAAILLQIRHLYSMGENNLTLRRDVVAGLGEKQFFVPPGIETIIPDVVRSLALSEVW